MPTQRTTLITFLALLLGFSFIALRMISPYLVALAMGGILAMLSFPIYQRLRARNFKPKLASLLVTLGVLVLAVGPLALFVTLSIRQGVTIAQSIASNEDFSFKSIFERVAHLGIVQALIGDPAAFELQLRTAIRGLANAASSAILSIVANLPRLLLQLVLALLACFFLLMDGRRFMAWMSDKVPLHADVRARLRDSLKDTTASVIWATVAAAAAQASVILLGFLALGVPAPFLAAGATFILAWIPMVGSPPVWIVGAIYLYTQGSVARTVAMVAVGLVTGIIDNFVRPWVLKGRSSMHPLVSLVAIFGGIGMFGIAGVFLGPILAAILIVLLNTWPIVGERTGVLAQSEGRDEKAA